MTKSIKTHKNLWGSATSTPTTIKEYLLTESFHLGDLINHPKFGKGSVEQSYGNKIDVRFEDKVRTLLNRSVL
jgi:hypothetical protein